jgi:hypothetical protein
VSYRWLVDHRSHPDAALRLQRILRRLLPEYRAIVVDVVERNLPVGVVAERWGASPEALSFIIRCALGTLVRAMAEVAATED